MLNKIRKRCGSKIITFTLKSKIHNKYLLRTASFIYNLLSHNYSYEPKYKDENHHYIPQFILKYFKIGNTGEIYEYQNNSIRPVKKSINKEAACLFNYYTFTSIKTKNRSIYAEKEIYSFIEGFASKIIKEIIQNSNYNLTDLEESILATYTSFQYTRTPAFRAQLKNYILFLIEERKIEPQFFSNKNKGEILGIILNNSLDIKRNELVEFNIKNKSSKRDVEALIRLKLQHLNSIVQLLSDKIASVIAQDIFRKKLNILKTKDPYFFILPDCGTMIYDFKDEYEYFLWPYGWNVKKDSVAVFLPISVDKCLLYSSIKINDLELLEDYTKLTISLAYHQRHRFVYSDRDSQLIQTNLNKFPVTNYFN